MMKLLLLFFPRRTWPCQTVQLADGRQVQVAELNIYAEESVLLALDDWETRMAKAGETPALPEDAPALEQKASEIIHAAQRAVAALAKNNFACGVPFPLPTPGQGFTIPDVLKLVRAAYGLEASLGKAFAPLSAPAAGCAACVSQPN